MFIILVGFGPNPVVELVRGLWCRCSNIVVRLFQVCGVAVPTLWSSCSMNVVRGELECIIILVLPYFYK